VEGGREEGMANTERQTQTHPRKKGREGGREGGRQDVPLGQVIDPKVVGLGRRLSSSWRKGGRKKWQTQIVRHRHTHVRKGGRKGRLEFPNNFDEKLTGWASRRR